MSESYREPIKHLARQRSLVHAIRILTTARTESTVIKVDEVEEVLDYAVGILGDPTIAKEAREEFITWTDIHKARVGIKRPGDLNVLYLCGPSPLNDLEILLELGISPHNVWAVEADESIAGKAVKQLANRGVAVKLHSGPLAEFLEALPEVFDLLYLDACGPLLGRRPSTLAPVLVAATHRRLAPYGVLVTNFSEMPSEQGREYAGVMASYFRYRFNDFPDALWKAGLDPALCEGDDTGLEEAVLCNADACYSELITRFIVDALRGFAPSLRAFASHAFSGALMIRDRKGPIERARNLPRNAKSMHEFIETAGDMVLNKASYPLFSFYEDLGRRAPQSPLFAQLTNLSLMRARFPEALCQTELLSHIIEGHWSLPSDRLKAAIVTPWFDEKARFSCDVPLPNLLINALLGVYGFPKFPVPERALRLAYTAKTRKMYVDVIPFDECRSFFDWWPSVDLVPARFRSRGFQVVGRCLIDRISWSDWGSESHPFRGGAVACHGDLPCADPRRFADREIPTANAQPDA